MPDYNFKMQRLFVEADLAGDAHVSLDKDQANYLINVLRLRVGATLLVFNGRDGEWCAQLGGEEAGRGRVKNPSLTCQRQMRTQTIGADIDYLFSPLKQARMDYMVQKAVEMGVSRLVPVRTEHTQVARVNSERLRANAIEACEQCGVLNVPFIAAYRDLQEVLADWDSDRALIFCDEAAKTNNPRRFLESLKPNGPMAVLIGPEGGFSTAERAQLHDKKNTIAIPLGPRILRADTAAVAALTAVQMICGDWL